MITILAILTEKQSQPTTFQKVIVPNNCTKHFTQKKQFHGNTNVKNDCRCAKKLNYVCTADYRKILEYSK